MTLTQGVFNEKTTGNISLVAFFGCCGTFFCPLVATTVTTVASLASQYASLANPYVHLNAGLFVQSLATQSVHRHPARHSLVLHHAHHSVHLSHADQHVRLHVRHSHASLHVLPRHVNHVQKCAHHDVQHHLSHVNMAQLANAVAMV